MDRLLNPKTGDYTGTRTNSLENAVYLRLMTPLSSYWADPALGSRLHELTREKDVSRIYVLARQYAEQALQPLLDDGRASSVRVRVHRDQHKRALLWIEITDAAEQTHLFKHSVRIA
ncbi:phage GP46 family protein [Xenorhabdus bovienii]|uniref:phage GP46 family protein n=1 Tax=Xenorhabdus bovienii TaxID=40576 RepID=UPI0023B2AB12|nr:phage GP46 family protein [Xenorhabdus bovienii]MDE9466894.1 phage GP46 family protein [Xenorhabdus bovienii]